MNDPSFPPGVVNSLSHLIHSPLLWWLLAGSLVVFLATLIAVPWIVVRLPADYFRHDRRHPIRESGNQLGYLALMAAKNGAGAVLLVLGVTMLVLPGQGLLTMLIGLSLLNFPGKYRLEKYIATRKLVFNSLNWIRRQGGRQPFESSGRASTESYRSVRAY